MLRHLLATTALAVALGGAAAAQEAKDATDPLVEEKAPAAESAEPMEDPDTTAQETPPVMEGDQEIATDPETPAAEEGESIATEPAAPAEDATTTAEEAPVAEEGETVATDPAAPADDAATTAGEAPLVEEGDTTTAQPADPLVPAPSAGEAPPAPVLMPVEIAELTAVDLVKASLQSPDGGTLGKVDNALFDDSGTIEALVVSFGGFLGFGTKTVEIGLDEVELMKDEGGNIVAKTPMTPEALESLPEYAEVPGA